MNLGINLNFTEIEREILVKVAAAQDIQEASYNVSTGKYKYKWNIILNDLLESDEIKTALGYMITTLEYKPWNNLQDLFDTVHYMPMIPKGLSEYNNIDRETKEYKEWRRLYMKIRYGLTGKYIVQYHPGLDSAEKFVDKLEKIDQEINDKIKNKVG